MNCSYLGCSESEFCINRLTVLHILTQEQAISETFQKHLIWCGSNFTNPDKTSNIPI